MIKQFCSMYFILRKKVPACRMFLAFQQQSNKKVMILFQNLLNVNLFRFLSYGFYKLVKDPSVTDVYMYINYFWKSMFWEFSPILILYTYLLLKTKKTYLYTQLSIYCNFEKKCTQFLWRFQSSIADDRTGNRYSHPLSKTCYFQYFL